MNKSTTNSSIIKIDPSIKELLFSEAKRINSPAFISADPVQFPRRFSDVRDIEIVSLLTAAISWGKRTMICNNAEKLLSLMDYSPYSFMMDDAVMLLDPKMNIHRTFFAEHLQYYIRGLKRVYIKYGSLDNFAKNCDAPLSEAPAWHFAKALGQELNEANSGAKCSQCVPTNLEATALKRINMALRWLVRNDGIVDMGVWRSISPSQLYIPLDVHSASTSRQLGLLLRRSNDRKAVEQLTATLRTINKEDPAIFDFALFGIGMGL